MRNSVASEKENITIIKSIANTSHLERKRLEYLRMKMDWVMIGSRINHHTNLQKSMRYGILYLLNG